jgi:protein phosphatase
LSASDLPPPPYDLIGDIHGCLAELEDLLDRLGWEGDVHPEGRTAVFLGDLVDRGPDTPGVLRRVMSMSAAGTALCVAGNHETKFARALHGAPVYTSHGLAESLEQMEGESADFRDAVLQFIAGLPFQLVLDQGRLVVAHAGLRENLHGVDSPRARSFALYGDTTGQRDRDGFPVRLPWQRDYRGDAVVVYGHTPVAEAAWVNNTLCLDTGVVFGGRLTALRYPEREIVDVPARQMWSRPVRPLPPVAT